MYKKIRALQTLLVADCLLVLGCSPANHFAMAPVRGQVTYHGKPVSGASVAFLCAGAPRPATAITDELGQYRLTTFSANDGAIIGTHVVTVRKLAAGNVSEPKSKPMD